MKTQKIQITLTSEESRVLSKKAAALGYSVTKYVKFIIASEAIAIMKEQITLQKK